MYREVNNMTEWLPLYPRRTSEYLSLFVGAAITGAYTAGNFLGQGYYDHKDIVDLLSYLFPNTLNWTLGLHDTNYALLWIVAYPVFLFIGRYLASHNSWRGIAKVLLLYFLLSTVTLFVDTYAWKLALLHG